MIILEFVRRFNLCPFPYMRVAPLALMLTGCSHNWVPGPNAMADLQTTEGRCRLMTSGSRGFQAQGSAKFVAAVAIASALSDAISNQIHYENCMRASGYYDADNTATAAHATAPVQQTVAYASPVIAAATSYPIAAMTVDKRVQIVLPIGWSQLATQPSGSDKLTGNTISTYNNQTDAQFSVYALPKGDDISDVQSMYLRVRPAIMAKSQFNTETNVTPITMDGRPALEWSVSVMTASGLKQGLLTVVDTGNYICLAAGVTMADTFASARPQFESMRRSLSETNYQASLVR